MDPLNLSAEGMTDAEQMLLSMIVSFASDQLTRTWTAQQDEPGDVVIYDIANPRARLAWERNRNLPHPIPVVLAEDPIPDLPWVLQKPVRTQRLIPFLNSLSDWMAQQTVSSTAPPAADQQHEDPFGILKQRLGAVASARLAREGVLQDLKLVISGSVAAGKSTAIHTISDIPPINTDVPATDAVLILKSRTTVALDYGELTLTDGKKLRLYGTPGQRRYDFMSKILGRGALGLVLLIDNRVENPLAELDYYASIFTDLINESAMVVGVTHRDEAPDPGLDRYERRLQTFHKPWPVFPVDPRKKADVVALLDALVTMLEHSRGPYAIAG